MTHVKRILVDLGALVVYTITEDNGFLFVGPTQKYYAYNSKYNLEVGPADSIEAVLYQYHSIYKEYRSKLRNIDEIDNFIENSSQSSNTRYISPNVVHVDFRAKRRL